MNNKKCDFLDYLVKIKEEYEALKSQLQKANHKITELENENHKLKAQMCICLNTAPSNDSIDKDVGKTKKCEFDSSFTVPDTDELNMAQNNISRISDDLSPPTTENIIEEQNHYHDPEDVISATPRPSLSSMALSAKKDRNKKMTKTKKSPSTEKNNFPIKKDELLLNSDSGGITDLPVIKKEPQTAEIDLSTRQQLLSLSPKKSLFGGLKNILDKNSQNNLNLFPSPSPAVVTTDQNVIDSTERPIKKEIKDNTTWHSKSNLLVNKVTPKKSPFSDGGGSTGEKSDSVSDKIKMPLKLSLSGLKRPYCSTKRLKQPTLDFTSQNHTKLQSKQLISGENIGFKNNNNNNSTLLSSSIDPNETYCEDVTGLRTSTIRSNTNKENSGKLLLVKHEPISPKRQPLQRMPTPNNEINNKPSLGSSSSSSSVFALPNDTDEIIIDVDDSEEMLNEKLMLNINEIKCDEEPIPIRTEYRQQPVTYTKKEKAMLPGFACADCLKWFEHVGKGMSEREIQNRINSCSKHKNNQCDLPATPEGFWIPYLQSSSPESS